MAHSRNVRQRSAGELVSAAELVAGEVDAWTAPPNNHTRNHQPHLAHQSKHQSTILYPPSSPSTTHSSIIDLDSPARSHDPTDSDEASDLVFVDQGSDIPESTLDGTASQSTVLTTDIFSILGRRGRELAGQFKRRYRPLQEPRPTSVLSAVQNMEGRNSNDYDSPEWPQAGENADAQDLAGPGAHGRLICTVSSPQKAGEGTQNPYVSYLVTTDTDFRSFQSSHVTVRRRFTDFVYLYKRLATEYPQCAVPPLPDKHNMSYVRGDRFSPDFTSRRAFSLGRFLKRLTLHPVLRRAAILAMFLETNDWNAVMRNRPNRGMSGSESASSSVLESWTDGFLNAFTKPHKTDKRFQDVNDRASKLDTDLGTVSKTVARVAKRESDLETDYAELATQFQKLAVLEPGVQDELTSFATSVQSTSEGWKDLKEHTDQDYHGSLKDMEAYISSIKALLKTREQKQLDFEGLTEYLNKAAQERDTLASHGSMGASGFLRQKIEDVRGVDHEQSRRERQRKLEVQISRLTTEVEAAKKTTEAFDEEVVKEVSDFERIKAVEFRDTLGGLADANIKFFKSNIDIWEQFIQDMEKQQAEAAAQAA